MKRKKIPNTTGSLTNFIQFFLFGNVQSILERLENGGNMYALAAVYCIHKVLFLHQASLPHPKPKSKMKRKRNYLNNKLKV